MASNLLSLEGSMTGKEKSASPLFYLSGHLSLPLTLGHSSLAQGKALAVMTQGLLRQPVAKPSRPVGASGSVSVNILFKKNESFMQILDNMLGHIRNRLATSLSGNTIMDMGTQPEKVKLRLRPFPSLNCE